MRKGFLYLVAIMDWASRKMLVWRVSNKMELEFCLDALARHGRPEIFNTDQGSQFTSARFTGVLKEAGIRVSMDGRGRWLDNVFIERLWRSLKYECVSSPCTRAIPARGCERASAAGSATTMQGAPTRPWRGARPMRHTEQLAWQDWQPDNNKNQAYPSRQTVRRTGTTSHSTPFRTGSQTSQAYLVFTPVAAASPSR